MHGTIVHDITWGNRILLTGYQEIYCRKIGIPWSVFPGQCGKLSTWYGDEHENSISGWENFVMGLLWPKIWTFILNVYRWEIMSVLVLISINQNKIYMFLYSLIQNSEISGCVWKQGVWGFCCWLPERERERLSLSAFLRTEDIGVHIVHISRLIITYTLE